MRDASREPAHALDLLGLHDSILDLPPLGDIAADPQVPAALARRPVARLDRSLAGGREHSMLTPRLAKRRQLAPRRLEPGILSRRTRARQHEIVEQSRGEAFERHAEQQGCRPVRVQDPAVGVQDQHRVGGVEERRSKTRLPLRQHGFRLGAFGDVEDEPMGLDELAGIEHAHDGGEHLDGPAVPSSKRHPRPFDRTVVSQPPHERLALPRRVVKRRHVGCQRIIDGREPQNAGERGIAGDEPTVGPRRVHAEAGVLDDGAVALVGRTRTTGFRRDHGLRPAGRVAGSSMWWRSRRR